MSESVPAGAVVSFAGTVFTSSPISAAAIGYPNMTDDAVEAIEPTLGLYPIDLYGTATPPARRVFTAQILLRAADGSGTPWTDLIASYNALRALPWVGTLVAHLDAQSSGTLSCTARRKGIPLKIGPTNCRHIVVDLAWTVESAWA